MKILLKVAVWLLYALALRAALECLHNAYFTFHVAPAWRLPFGLLALLMAALAYTFYIAAWQVTNHTE